MPCLTINKEQREAFDSLRRSKVVDKWMRDPAAVKLGNTDFGTFKFLWNRFVGSPFDPITRKITQKDIKVFESGVLKEWLPTLGKRAGFFQTYFKLPKALVRNIKGGEDFINRISEAISYNQRQMKEGSAHISKMIDGLYKMMSDPNSPILNGREWTRKEYDNFQKLERKLELSKDPVQREKLLKDLIKIVGTKDTKTDNTLGGEILRRFNKLLTNEILPSQQTAIEKRIVRHWNILRADSIKNLLNGAISARRTIETLSKNDPGRPHLLAAHEKLTEAIEGLLIEGREGNKYFSNEFIEKNHIWIPSRKNQITITDPVTGGEVPYILTNSKTGQPVVGINGKKYSPRYVIEVTDIMHNLVAYSRSTQKGVQFKGKTSEQILDTIEKDINPTAISNRLKQAGDTDRYFTLDPNIYLNRYVHDVASFNLRSRINHSYAEITKDIVQSIRLNNAKDKNIKIGEYTTHLLEMITEIKETALVNNGSSKTSMDEAVRMINAFEYISKLGFSVKGGLKNRTQALFNWVAYGRRGYRVLKEFKNTSSREYDTKDRTDIELTNVEMIERQLKRFGLWVGEKGEISNISSATEGSLDIALIPKGFDVNLQGQLVVANKASMVKRAADRMAWFADISSKWTPLGKFGSQQWAENANRLKTFEMQFALSFKSEQNRMDYHKRALYEKLGRAPTTKELYDRIETISGNQSLQAVKFLHYDYENWAKARILQGKAGKVVGQYQHFKFAFFDMQYNMIRDAVRDIKNFRWTVEDPLNPGQQMVSPFISTGMRLTSLYSWIPALIAVITNHDVGGVMSTFGITPFEEDRVLKDGTLSKADRSSSFSLIENPVLEDVSRFLDFVSNSPDGDEHEMLKHYGAYYGKNPITANLGPFVSDLFSIGELTDFLNLTGEEYEKHKNLNYDPTNPEWQYNVARIFNIQASRTFWRTLPAYLDGHHYKMFRIETGTYAPKWITKWRQEQIDKHGASLYTGEPNALGIALPEHKIGKKHKKTKKSKERQEEILYRKALTSIADL
tara:strand:- start:4170 stop:7232 length:3063 start_codon:yes stop_codon:yes gene_type:complete